jgi:tetratricopeptide (TPR) repeat protein
MRWHPSALIGVCCFAVLLSLPTYAQQDDSSPAQVDKQRDKSDDNTRAAEESSSKDTRVDLSPPSDDQKNHPQSGAAMVDAEDAASDVQEMHPWDPHKAAKDVEVGDFYFKRKNYHAALERYKEALIYKPNDALANFRLAECSEKTGNVGDAVTHYQEYLKILPHGPLAPDAEKALGRLKASGVSENSATQKSF